MLIPVLLTGGIGSRLWPLSRENYPKQFLPLLDTHSLFQQTLQRLDGLCSSSEVLILAQETHRFLVAEQLRQLNALDDVTLLLEPLVRNTAPAVALAALQALQQYPEDSVLLVLPADHSIDSVPGFQATVKQALPLAEKGHLVTFGVQPTQAETGYGYLQQGAPVDNQGACIVDRFIEKPDQQKADTLLAQGNCLWNSGMFMFRAARYLEVLQAQAPEIYEAVCKSHRQAKHQEDFIRPCKEAFAQSPEDSIDYAVMEKSDDVVMVPLQTQWCDVGSWAALADHLPADEKGNVCVGQVRTEETHNSYIHSSHRLVTAVGISNAVIVETADAVLVLNKDNDQALKPLVQALRKEARPEVTVHRSVHRPWGAYEALDKGGRYQVKRITVAVGAKLSLQLHHHRSEHWVVVEGSARVTRGEDRFLLTENQSTYIPIGVRHCLENVGKIPLEIIEVQSGSYLGEDDIVRLEDIYGRTMSVIDDMDVKTETV